MRIMVKVLGWCQIVCDVLVEIVVGEIFGLVGFNGLGKFMLLCLLVGLLLCVVGQVVLDDILLSVMVCCDIVCCLVFVEQYVDMVEVLCVCDVVELGCMLWLLFIVFFGVQDVDIVDMVLVCVDMQVMVDWCWVMFLGGECQCVYLVCVLVQ